MIVACQQYRADRLSLLLYLSSCLSSSGADYLLRCTQHTMSYSNTTCDIRGEHTDFEAARFRIPRNPKKLRVVLGASGKEAFKVTWETIGA